MPLNKETKSNRRSQNFIIFSGVLFKGDKKNTY